MSWKPSKPSQPSLGDDFAPKDWSKPTPPQPVRAQDKIGPRPVRAVRQDRARQGPVQDEGQWWRMWELKRRVAARLEAGEDHATALAAVKRELWPEEYQGVSDGD